MKIRHYVTLVCPLLLVPTATAQMITPVSATPPPCVQRNPPTSECSCCGPLPVRLWCIPVVKSCRRRDVGPTLTDPGTPEDLMGPELPCRNCTGCPDNPPPGNSECHATFSMEVTLTRTTEIAVGISGGDCVSIKLDGSFGGSESGTQTIEITCGLTEGQPPCTWSVWQPRVTVYRGRKYVIKHIYSRRGICWGAGGRWSQVNCCQRESRTEGDWIASIGCEEVDGGSCVPVEMAP